MQFDDDLLRPQVPTQLPECGLVVVVRRADEQLLPEFLGGAFLHAQRRRIIEQPLVAREAAVFAQFVHRQPLHPDEHAAARAGTARPRFYTIRDLPPATQVEVSHAEIGSIGLGKRLP